MGKSNKRDDDTGQGPSESHSSTSSSAEKSNKPKKSMKSSTYFSDPLLIPRINQYLSDNKDKVYVDINDMVSELQTQYRDYARRKRSAFKPLVERAFSFVLQQCGISQGECTEMENYEESSGNSSSDVEECQATEENGNKSSTNTQLINLYNPSQLQAMSKHYQACSTASGAELIDLSSDDESAKKKDEVEDTSASAAKLNTFQTRIAGKETTLSVLKGGPQNHAKSDRPNVSITAKRGRDVFDPKSDYKSVKRRRHHFATTKATTFSDFGASPKLLEEVCKLILHISHPEIYREIGVSSPRGFLLHGPPGCGKTLLANAIAGELEVELLQVSGPELIGGVSGESEERIRDLFEKAIECAPCVLFIDEVDAICPNRQNAQKEMERRIVAQLLTSLDELNVRVNGDLVLVIGATNRPDSIDPALRRAGRFDREVCIGIPDLKTREKILRIHCANLNLSSDFSYEELAQITPGFVGADLLALTREAAMVAINRVFCLLQTFRSKSSRRKAGNGNAEKIGMSKEQMEKIGDETMDVDFFESKSEMKESGSAQPCDPRSVGVPLQKAPEMGQVGEQALEKAVEKEDSNKGKVSLEAKGSESAGSGLGSITERDSSGTSAKEMKPVESDDEMDIEVISDSTSSRRPSLDVLLYWLRDSSPLPYHQLKSISISQSDFKEALRVVQPSSKREGFATVPDVTWDDVGSLADVREELQMSILGPVKYRKQFEELGLSAPGGILICGPPGCGKTLLAKAVANEAGINFISVKGPELLNMYVGESERAVRQCFERAKSSAPCVIFFDELDALCPRRSDSGENGASMRVVNQLLTEMDGVEERKEVYLMAATNRPDIIDPAVLRPGRLDKVIYVGLPRAEDRADILKALTKNGTRPKLGDDVNLTEIAMKKACDGFSGADLAALIREAGIQAVKEFMKKSSFDQRGDVAIHSRHFERAMSKIRPSVAPEEYKYYEGIRRKYVTTKT